MVCDRCGAQRRPSGPCPSCGAPPPGGSSLRQYGNRAGDAGRGQRRGSGAGWGNGDRNDYSPPAGRSNGGNSNGRNHRRGDYQEIDLERALVPSPQDLAPINVGTGLPAIPGLPQSDDEERALGIRRPAYIPANSGQRKRRISSFRVLSGVLSLMLICVATCAGTALLAKPRLDGAFANHVIGSHLTPVTYNFTQVPATPAATPGPAVKFVTSATTARNIDNNFAPVDITSKFTVNSYVYVVLSVRNVPAGTTHTVSVRWFLNGLDIQLPPNALTKNDHVVKDVNAYFALQYPQPGLGMAKIYWDRPANDSGDGSTNQYLAQTIYFAIQPPAPTVTPTPKGTTTPNGTPGA